MKRGAVKVRRCAHFFLLVSLKRQVRAVHGCIARPQATSSLQFIFLMRYVYGFEKEGNSSSSPCVTSPSIIWGCSVYTFAPLNQTIKAVCTPGEITNNKPHMIIITIDETRISRLILYHNSSRNGS